MTAPAGAGWAVAAALAVLAGWLFTRRSALRRELDLLADRIADAELGRLDRRLPPSAVAPLGRIAEAVNALIRRLAARVEDVSRERARLLAVMERMAEGVLVLDRDGRIALANPAAAALLGAGAVPGAALPEAVRAPRLLERLAAAARGPVSGEVELAGPPARWLLLRATPLAGGPEPDHVLAVLDDVTEFKRLDQVRRDFVANASHELKTPLAAIQGYAEVLAEEAGGEEARVIHAHAVRLSKLVEDLLVLSRIEARRLDVKLRPIELSAFVGRALQLVAPQAQAKRIALERDTGERLAVLADEEALLQILVNLLDNAVKYTPEGGRVTVAARPAPDDRVSLAVRDTGPGIPAEHLPRLFERFYRVDRARSRELGGTGLGLAIVKHLAEVQGGEAYVESRSGTGTEAGVRLPAAAPS